LISPFRTGARKSHWIRPICDETNALGNGMNIDPLVALIQTLAKPAIHLGHRLVAEGDERALMPEEADFLPYAAVSLRRQSGAARIVARGLLERLHHRGVAILKASSGAPIWPPGIVGSLAHDHTVAVAAVARATDISCLGIDIEPAEPLPNDLFDFIARPGERLRYGQDHLKGRHLFVAKEAVYKAVYPEDGVFLDFQDIEVDLEKGEARTSYGRTVTVELAAASHVIALGYEA
jgi:4'-phosphopantetheinyl transferase EntD